ncbi:MAG: helix-turn-helix domain-containing protein [Selenomonadaceae bacterium]|nr:helix-turn-helix domain-containing protein [Selenomonadaceae bacterium]
MKKFFSVKEVAEIFGVSKSLICYRIRKKYIPSRRVGRRILIQSSYIMKIRIV